MTAFPRPLEGRYGVSLTIAILALAPYIVVTTAYPLYRDQVSQAIGAGRTALEIIAGIATAGYAFGALLGGDLINRFPQRRLFFPAEGMFIVGCLLAASAGGTVVYGTGRVLQGLATGLLLVIALPPVIQRFPPDRMPITAAFVNIGFFGAVTLGPLLGGAVAAGHAWRWFYGGLAAIGLVIFALALITLPDQEPPNRGLPFDRSGIVLGLAATVLPFWAVGALTGQGFGSLLFALPFALGIACFAALLLTEYHKAEPLSPVKMMWTTLPVIGTLVAMIAGGVLVTFLMLAMQYLLEVEHHAPLSVGFAFWPQVVGVLITAGLLGVLLRTRFLPLLILAGMLALIGGGALLLTLGMRGSPAAMRAAAGLLGLGAGATVSPGLYLAAFSLPSKMVGRIFALVELVRSVADFILAPVMLEVARVASGGKALTADGLREAIWITILITIGATLFGVVLYLVGGAGLPRPDLEAWLKEGRTAVTSPLLGQAFRRRG
jgi:MFS family permease